MAVYRFEAEVGEDHRLELPAAIPLGRVEIEVRTQHEHAADGPSFRALVGQLAKGQDRKRTMEEIVASVRRERESWE